MAWTEEDRKDMFEFLEELTIEQQAQFPIEVRRGDRFFTPEEILLYEKLRNEWTYKRAEELLHTLRELTPEHQAWFPEEVWRGERDLTSLENQMLHQFSDEEIYAERGALVI